MDTKMILSSATFDMTGKYRYSLSRVWDISKPRITFLMLNPSTADDKKDDPTIRRCIGFAKAWGYGGLDVVNLFALISSDPAALLTVPDAVGECTDDYILESVQTNLKVVIAWGAFKEAQARAAAVLKLLGPYPVYCLGITKGGCPKHPLYIKGDTLPLKYRTACGCYDG